MAQENYPKQEVDSIEFDQLRTQEQYPGQVRANSYVFKVSTINPDTGERILHGEYRTYATNEAITVEEAQARLIEVLEQVLRGL